MFTNYSTSMFELFSLHYSLTVPGLLANYGLKCSSSSQCADLGAYCDLTMTFPQCHQPSAASGLYLLKSSQSWLSICKSYLQCRYLQILT